MSKKKIDMKKIAVAIESFATNDRNKAVSVKSIECVRRTRLLECAMAGSMPGPVDIPLLMKFLEALQVFAANPCSRDNKQALYDSIDAIRQSSYDITVQEG